MAQPQSTDQDSAVGTAAALEKATALQHIPQSWRPTSSEQFHMNPIALFLRVGIAWLVVVLARIDRLVALPDD